MIKLLFKLFRKQFTKLVIGDFSKPLTHKDLEFAFADTEGRRYYKFPSASPFPISRHAERDKLLIWLNRNLTGEQLGQLLEQMETSIHAGLKDPSHAAKVAAIVAEIRSRKDMIVSMDILINIAAVHWIREDEEPMTYSEVIHQEKCNQFKKEVADGNHYFFFQQTELANLFNFQKFSEESLKEYLKASELAVQQHKATIEYLTTV